MFAIFPTLEPHEGILEVRDRAMSNRETSVAVSLSISFGSTFDNLLPLGAGVFAPIDPTFKFLRATGVVMLVWGLAHVLSLLSVFVGFNDFVGSLVFSYIVSALVWIGGGVYCLKGAQLITRIAYPSGTGSNDDSS